MQWLIYLFLRFSFKTLLILLDLCWIGSQLLFPSSPPSFAFSQIFLAFSRAFWLIAHFLLIKAKRIWLKAKGKRGKEEKKKYGEKKKEGKKETKDEVKAWEQFLKKLIISKGYNFYVRPFDIINNYISHSFSFSFT